MPFLIRRVGYLLGGIALLGGCANSIQSATTNVVEIFCEGSWEPDSTCKGELTAGGLLEFKINPITKSVLLSVEKNHGKWLLASKFFNDCTIVDTDNWECGHIEKVGMRDGAYSRYSEGEYGYEIHGITGWRYWAYRIGKPRLAFWGLNMERPPIESLWGKDG